MLNSGLERRIEEVVYLAMRVFYVDVGDVLVVGANGMLVAVQSQYGLFGRKNAHKKQQQKIRYVLAKGAHRN